MSMLSSLSSSSPPLIELFKDRVSSSLSSSSSSSSSSSAFSDFGLRRRFVSTSLMCYCCSSKLPLMADSSPRSSSCREDKRVEFRTENAQLFVRSGEELLAWIRKESRYGRLRGNVASALEELYENYRNAVFSSGNPHAEEIVLSNMSAILDCVLLDVEDPFIFPPYHKAVREPYDYYAFGQNFMRPLIDFGSSYVGNITIFNEMEEKRQEGHNIILMSNHQTEADPAIIALLLEETNPYIAENMVTPLNYLSNTPSPS